MAMTWTLDWPGAGSMAAKESICWDCSWTRGAGWPAGSSACRSAGTWIGGPGWTGLPLLITSGTATVVSSDIA